ncbi:MAG: YdhR family protein [Pseudonocardia sp.]|nr:YdhR family protein [Pseudonocardia sp.]
MHTLLITFRLVDMTDARYREVCAELAPAFAELPGLLAKVWLTDVDAGYGGVYLFADEAGADAFLASGLFRTVRTFPHFDDLDVRRFGVDERTTRRTQPRLTVVNPAPATSPVTSQWRTTVTSAAT